MQNDNHTVPGPRYAKRQRLSSACTQCRKRKVRCDEQQPQCRNCVLRNEECVTFDLKATGAIRTEPRTEPSLRQRTKKAAASVPTSTSTPTSKSMTCSPSRSASVSASVSTLPNSNPNDDPSPRNTEDEDTLGQSYDRAMILNTDHTSYKRKLLGGGTLQALSKHLDRYFEAKGLRSISPRFAFGMEHAEEVPLPSLGNRTGPPALPPSMEFEQLASIFHQHIYPIYPVLDMASLRSDFQRISVHALEDLPHADIPKLCCLYLLASIAADKMAGSYTDMGSLFLTAAYSLMAYLTSIPYLPSVQALLLLTIALKARNKDGAGRQTLGQAIRIAQSIGLHRRLDTTAITPGQSNFEHDQQLDARVWWSCYILEKAMSLEVGRPMAFEDSDCTQIIPSKTNEDDMGLFGHMIGLAKIQSCLVDIIYRRPLPKRNAASLFHDLGSVDRTLCEWATRMPDDIRPTSDLCCPLEKLHFASYLSIIYHQTIINIHQVALMIDAEIYRSKVELHCQGNLWHSRMLASEKILLSSARKIANLQIDLLDHGTTSQPSSMTSIMLAIVIIGLNIVKNPTSTRNPSDLELVNSLSKHAEAQYSSAGQHTEFIKAIHILRSQIEANVRARGIYSGRSYPDSIIQSEPLPIAIWGDSGHRTRQDSEHAWPVSQGTLENPSYLFSDYPMDHPWDWMLSDAASVDSMQGMDWNTLDHQG